MGLPWVQETLLAWFPVFAARGFGQRPKMCRPSANTENFRRTREKPLVPKVRWGTQASVKFRDFEEGRAISSRVFNKPLSSLAILPIKRLSFQRSRRLFPNSSINKVGKILERSIIFSLLIYCQLQKRERISVCTFGSRSAWILKDNDISPVGKMIV